MADNVIRRFVMAIFDRESARKVEGQLEESLGQAGKKGGENFLREVRAAFDKRMADLKVQLAKGIIDPKQFKAQANLAAKEFNTGLLTGMEKARKAGSLTDKEYLKLSRTLKTVGVEGGKSGNLLSSTFGKLGVQLAGVFAFTKVVTFFRESITAAFEAEKSVGQFSLALAKLGIAYDQVGPSAEKMLDTIQKTTRFTDEDARDALTTLITITGDYDKSLKLLNLTADVAAKRNTTMAAAAETVGKASQGMSRGMQDLGVRAGATGDIVGKLRTTVGGFAEVEGKQLGTQVASLNNLWGEFKERVGLAIIGSDGMGNSVGTLRRALIGLTEWIEKNGDSIGRFVDRAVGAATFIGNLSAKIINNTPNLYTASKAWDWLSGKVTGAGDAHNKAAAAIGTATSAIIATRRGLTSSEQTVLTKLLEDGADDRIRITAREMATIRQIEKDAASGLLTLTKEQDDAITALMKTRQREAKSAGDKAAREAEEQRKRFTETKAALEQEIVDLGRLRIAQSQGSDALDTTTRLLADEAALRTAIKDLLPQQAAEIRKLVTARNAERDAMAATAKFEADTRAQIDAISFDEEVAQIRTITEMKATAARDEAIRQAEASGPDAVAALNRELFIQDALFQAGAISGTAFGDQVASLAASQYDAANAFKTPWTEALDAIKKEVQGSGTLFKEMAQAWAEGGFAGVVALAKAKVKENVARAIEEGAKAFGSFALGNPVAAAMHAKAAAGALAAAAAWRVVAAAGGGGGAAATAGGGGSVTNAGAGDKMKPIGPEIQIHLIGPGFDALNPKIQRVVWGAQQQARERYGDNARVNIVRREA